MRMPNGYQTPKGNPKQHIAHFVETCENAGTQRDLLVKKFLRSLKGNAFDWYTDLEHSQSIVGNNSKEIFLIDSIACVAR